MTKIHERPNRASPSEAGSFVEEADRYEQDRENRLAILDADFKAKKRAINKEINESLKEVFEDAKKQGVNKGVVRAIVDQQRLKRKAQAILERADDKVDGLEDDDREFAVDIRQALGDDFSSFGLGAAAVEREDNGEDSDVDNRDDTTNAVVTAVRGSMSEKEWDEAGAGLQH